MNPSITVGIGQALSNPDTWSALLAILTALGGLYHGWRKGADVMATKRRVEMAANAAADIIVALVKHDLIPPDGARIVLEWEARFESLARMAGLDVTSSTRADARSVVIARLGKAALEHGLSNLATAAQAVSATFDTVK